MGKLVYCIGPTAEEKLCNISNSRIQQHQYAKMASFKIFLVVALVAFIGSTDALKCKKKGGPEETCGDGKTTCVIEVKLTMTGTKKPTFGSVEKQECITKDLGNLTKKFDIPPKIDAGDSITFYCNTAECNVQKEIKNILKEDAATTIAAIKEANKTPTKADEAKGGAAQTTVAVATILFSMAMARLAL